MAKIAPGGDGVGDANDAIGDNGDAAPNRSGISSVAGIGIAKLPGADSGAGSDNGDTVKRGRGRPAGSAKPKSAKREAPSQSSIKGIEKILFSLHAMAAAALNTEELQLDEGESKLLSEAVTEVASHYNTVVDPKIIAWVGLIGVCGKIYAPRILAIRLRKQLERNASPE